MDVPRAIDYINNLILQPGWKVSATDHTNRFQGGVGVRIDYHCANSNRDKAKSGYSEMIDTYASFAFSVEECSEYEVYFRVVLALIKIHIHETREFTRVGGTFEAPFHPHRVEEMRRWESLAAGVTLAAGVDDDLQFGLA